MTKIDKNVPIPKPKLESKYPFDQLEVGESFELDKAYEGTIRSQASFRNRTRAPLHYIVRVDGDKIRVWRDV